MTVDELVGSVRKLRVYLNKGQRASYPSIALLWAPGPAQQGALRLTPWPDTECDLTWLDSFTGPSIGSLRRGTAPLGGCNDYQLLLRFNRERLIGTAALVTRTDLAAESPERRVAALTGVAVEALSSMPSPAQSARQRRGAKEHQSKRGRLTFSGSRGPRAPASTLNSATCGRRCEHAS